MKFEALKCEFTGNLSLKNVSLQEIRSLTNLSLQEIRSLKRVIFTSNSKP